MTDRPLPQNTDAEVLLLSAVLNDERREYFAEGLAIIPADKIGYFARRDHAAIWSAIVRLYERNSPLQVLVLEDELRASGDLDNIGGRDYLTDVYGFFESPVHTRHFAELVRTAAFRRSLIAVGHRLVSAAHDATREPLKIQADTSSELQSLAAEALIHEPKSLAELIVDVVDRAESECEERRFPIGLPKLDGLKIGAGDMITIAGRPGDGKSIALMMAAESLAGSGHTVGLVSLEMKGYELALRTIRRHLSIDENAIKANAREIQEQFCQPGANFRLFIDAPFNTSIDGLRARIASLVQRQGANVILIDYLQLIRSNRRHHNENEKLTEISWALKSVAMEHSIPVIVACQLNREIEKENRAPRLSDIRGSGSIEQDSSVVAILHRVRTAQQQASTRDTGPGISATSDDDAPIVHGGKGVRMELHVCKNRHGRVGKVSYIFWPHRAEFRSPDDPPPEPPAGEPVPLFRGHE